MPGELRFAPNSRGHHFDLVVAGPENWKDVTTHVNRMYIIRSEMKDANALLLTVVCFFDVQAILDSLDASQSWPPAFSSTLF